MAKVFKMLGKSSGLKGLGIISNCIGLETFESISENFITKEGILTLRKFILKDPNPAKPYPLQCANMLSKLNDVSSDLKKMRVLTISKVGMDLKCIQMLG